MPIGAVCDQVSRLAGALNVSHTMVALRLFQAGMIEEGQWLTLREMFRAQWLQSRARERAARQEHDGVPSYYVVRRQRLGNALLDLVHRWSSAGALMPVKAGQVLGVRARRVEPLLRRAA